jgi:hypothetical protein
LQQLGARIDALVVMLQEHLRQAPASGNAISGNRVALGAFDKPVREPIWSLRAGRDASAQFKPFSR